MKSAFDRITSKSARGTTRVYQTAESGFQTADRIGAYNSLNVQVGKSTATVTAASGTFPSPSAGSEILLGTERNLVQDAQDMSSYYSIDLKNIFTGSGEGQGRTNLDISTSSITHLSSIYKLSDFFMGAHSIDSEEVVMECSGRGLCDETSGLCQCFEGYTNDNCDTQNVNARK
jgi:hypothetical protein